MTRLPDEREIFRYYSQHGEDCLLWKFFDFKPTGWYVDIGAFDGIYLSNSYSFEQKGWEGICVEPHPDFFTLCRDNRPQATCLQVVCAGSDDQPVGFQTERLGLLSTVLSDEDTQSDIVRRYQNRGLEFSGFKTVALKTLTLDTIIEKHMPKNVSIDFVSIDVEGAELDVLRGFDLKRHRPRVVVVEANGKDQSDALDAVLARAGSSLARTLDVNRFYASSEEDIERLRGIEVSCAIEKQMHPLGSDESLPDYVRGLIISDGEAELTRRHEQTLAHYRENAEMRSEKLTNLVRQKGEEIRKLREAAKRNKARFEKLLDLKTAALTEKQERLAKLQPLLDELKNLKGAHPVLSMLHSPKSWANLIQRIDEVAAEDDVSPE